MSEENKITETDNTDASKNDEGKSAFRASELQNLSDYIRETGINAEGRKSELERYSASSLKEKEERIARAKALMEENTERAKKNADARLARLEYSGEYRQRLSALENKKAEQQRANRIAMEDEEKKAIEEERAREISEFRRREEEEARQRALASKKLLSDIESKKHSQPMSDTDGREFPESRTQMADEVAEDAEKCDTPPMEADSKEKIILNINPNVQRTAFSASEENEDNVLRFGMKSVSVGAAAFAAVNKSVHTPELNVSRLQIEGGKDSAADNLAQKAGAVEIAYGTYKDEIRMLEEQEHFYNQEAEAAKAQRLMYSEGEGRVDFSVPAYNESYVNSDYGTNLPNEPSIPLEYRQAEHYNIQADTELHADAILDDEGISAYEQSRIGEHIAVASEEFNKTQTAPEFAAADYMSTVDDEFDTSAYDIEVDGYFSSYAKSELPKSLNKYHKEKALLEKQLRITSKEQSKATIQKNAVLIVAKIGIQKEIIELTVETLMACIYAKSKLHLERQRHILEKCVAQYNGFCDEYEMLVGKPLPKISETMADDVAAGRVTAPIPNIYYPSDSSALSESGRDVDSLRHAEELNASYGGQYESHKEIERIIAEDGLYLETEEEAVIRKKERAEKAEAVKRAIERDIFLIGLRNEYRLSDYLAQRDMISNSFSVDKKGKARKLDEIDKKISKERGHLKKAIKLERDDNTRYYALLMNEGQQLRVKKRSRSERLNALKMRLEVLLSEREQLNERLIALYGGSGKKIPSGKISRKAAAIRKKHATIAYKKNKSLAAKIEKLKAPLDMKEKAFSILNKKIESAATIEESVYKLNKLKPKGEGRRELIADIKRAKQVIKQADADLKFLMKKMRKREEKYIADRNWGIFLGAVALLTVLGIALWVVFGDSISAYFSDVYSKLTGK